MKVLLDTNVLLDVLLKRQPWYEASKGVWDACDTGRVTGYIASISVTNVSYIARKVAGLDKAREAISLLLKAFEILSVDRAVLEAALALPGRDFEDGVQLAAAVSAGLERVVTRNTEDFQTDHCQVVTPDQLLMQLE